MFVHIDIDRYTKPFQLKALAKFCTELAENTTAIEPETDSICVGDNATSPAQPADPAETVTRKARRTKAEIAADEAATKKAAEPAEPAVAAEPAEPAEPAVETAPAVTTGKVYTEADVQALATLVARSKGPDVVKDKIAELGASRIAELPTDKLAELGLFLEGQK